MIFTYSGESVQEENTVSDQSLDAMSKQLLVLAGDIYRSKMSGAVRLLVKGFAREQLKSLETAMRNAKNSGLDEARIKAEEKGITHLLDNPLLCRPDKKDDPVLFLLELIRPIMVQQLRGKNVVVSTQNHTVTSVSISTPDSGCEGR